MMILSFIGHIIIIITLPLCVFFVDKSISYYLCCVIIALLGICDAALYNNLYELLSKFPKENLVYKNTGQSFSGILICLIRFLTIFSSRAFNVEDNQRKSYELIIFYTLSVLASISSIILLVMLHTRESFNSRFEKSFTYTTIGDSTSLTISKGEMNLNSTGGYSKKEEIVKFSEIVDDISIFCFTMFTNAFIWSSLYPGCTFSLNFFNLNDYIKPNTMVFVFNLLDMIGRYIPKYFQMSQKQLTNLLFFRFVFFLTYPLLIMIEKKEMMDDLLSFIVLLNLIIFSITNGLIASNIYTICFDRVKKKYMDKFGAALGSFLSSGVLVGSLFASFVVEKYFL